MNKRRSALNQKAEKFSFDPRRSLSSLRVKPNQPETSDINFNYIKKLENLENTLTEKCKEIERLEQTNQELLAGKKKRDEIIASALEENKKLKDKLRYFEKLSSKSIKLLNLPKANPKKPKTTRESSKKHSKSTYNLLGVINCISESKPLKKFKSQIKNLLSDQTNFSKKLSELEEGNQEKVAKGLENAVERSEDLNKVLFLVKRLKKVIEASQQISVSLVLSQAIDHLALQVCDTLDCDRASVFILDELNGELWTKAAVGTEKQIRIPMNKGFVGYAVTHKTVVNVKDAYSDTRFNKIVDIQTNYRTKSVLCVPIFDNFENIIGATQAINKREGIFTPDDVCLLEMMCVFAGSTLKNSMQNENSQLSAHKLRVLVNSALEFLQVASKPELFEVSEEKAKCLLESQEVLVYEVLDNKLVRYHKGLPTEFSLDEGIVGMCAKEKRLENIPSAYVHPNFNPRVDIDTSLPVVCFPLVEQERVIGIIEVLNNKGVLGRSSTRKAKLNQLDQEMLQLFGKVFVNVVTKFK